MPVFRMDVHRKSGAVMLWLKTTCGFIPIMGRAGLEGVKEFAGMLLNFYNSRKGEREKVKEVSDYLPRQALGDEE